MAVTGKASLSFYVVALLAQGATTATSLTVQQHTYHDTDYNASRASAHTQASNSLDCYDYSHAGYWDGYTHIGSTANDEDCAALCSAHPGCEGFSRKIRTSATTCWGYGTSSEWGGAATAWTPNPNHGGSPTNDNAYLKKSTCLVPAPTPAPSAPPAGAGGGAAAVGDPHLQNVHGERFDLMKEGKHVLMTIPRGKDAEHALLRVQADARRMGNKCADMYFQEVNVTGVWAEAKNAGGYRYSVSQHDREAPEWVAFGKVELKVVHGRTDGGLPYLNVYMKHLRSAGVAIGGLLGEDDHEDVITPPEACTRKVALAKRQTSGQALSSASSIAMATYEE